MQSLLIKLFPKLTLKNIFDDKFLRFFFGALTLLSLFFWYSAESEAEPWSILPGKQESSRFTTIRKITDSANNGYYFQLSPGVPMEHEWEDTGVHFLLVSWGILKKTVGLGPLDAFKDPYRVELFVIILPLVLIFFTRLFSLPKWYWVLIPIFFLWAMVPKYPLGWEHIQKINGLLYLSVSTRWIRIPCALWSFTVCLQFFQWYRTGTFLRPDKKMLLKILVMGFIYGMFVSVRKDLWVCTFLALTSWLILLSGFSRFVHSHINVRALKRIGFAMLYVVIIFTGIFTYRGLICTTMTARDKVYEIQKVSRHYGRPTWHSLTAALGVVPNKYGIVWGDVETFDAIKKYPGNENVVYGTMGYESAARRYYFHLLKTDPDLFVRSFRWKLNQIWQDHKNGLSRAFLFITVLFFLGPFFRWLGLMLLTNIVAHAFILVVVNPWLHYGLDLVTFYRLAELIGPPMILAGILRFIWDKNAKVTTLAAGNV